MKSIGTSEQEKYMNPKSSGNDNGFPHLYFSVFRYPESTIMKIRCINNQPLDKEDPTYPDLTLGNIYDVIAIDLDSYRIVGNEGKPYLYDTRRFEVVDPTIPEDWIRRISNEGQELWEPPELGGFFFEEYHDLRTEVIIAFDQYLLGKFQKEKGELEAMITHPVKQNRPKITLPANAKKRSSDENAKVTIMNILCTDNYPRNHQKKLLPDLSQGNVYFLIGIEGEYYRILGDLGRPYLYHKSRFNTVSIDIGNDWKKSRDFEVGDIWYPSSIIEDKDTIFEDFFSYGTRAKNRILTIASKIQSAITAKIYDENVVINLISD